MRTCPVCRSTYTPQYNTTQKVCSAPCAYKRGKTKTGQKDAKSARAREKRQAKEKAKTNGQLATEAQTEFNRYIRARDYGLHCICCDRDNDGTVKWNASHYKPVGANPHLRFDEQNCHGGCERCNSHLSGNLGMYREGLRVRYGTNILEYLETPQPAKNYRADDLREIKAKYRAKWQALEKSRE